MGKSWEGGTTSLARQAEDHSRIASARPAFSWYSTLMLYEVPATIEYVPNTILKQRKKRKEEKDIYL